MSIPDLSRFQFSGGETAAPIADLSTLPEEDKRHLVLAGIDVADTNVSGAFMQLNHADVHCDTRREGLELMDIRAALKKYDGLPRHYWNLLSPDKDDVTRLAHEHCNGGYFVRVKKGVKLTEPVQSCMFIKHSGAGQAVHNIVIVEEGAELHMLGGCSTSHGARDAAHLEAISDTLYHGILSAHSHQPVCGRVSQGRYPVVQGEWHGDYIGVMKVLLDTMSMRVVGAEPALERVPVGRSYTDAEALAWNRRIDSLMASTRIAGGYPLGRVLATSEAHLTHDRDDKHIFTELGTLVCESYAEAYRRTAGAADDDVVVGVCHYGTVRAPLPMGDVRVMDVGEVLPFSNRIRTFRMTGAELMRLVEFGLNNRRYGRMQFNGLEVLADSADTFRVHALSYVQPATNRRVEIKPDTPCIVAADEFMTTGGDGYPVSLFPDAEEIEANLPTTTEAFIQHIQRLGKVCGDPARVRKLISPK